MKFVIAWIKKYIFKIKSPSKNSYEWDDLINKYFDYEIIGEYYDNDGKGHLYKKYNRRYFRRKTKK